MLRRMTTLITGATGFVGSAVARTFAKRGHALRLLARPSSDRRLLEGLDAEIVTGDLTDPAINITASGTVSDGTSNIAITGTGSNPQINLTSSPSLPQDELMARILFGGPVGSLTTIQAVQLASSLNTLRGGKGGLNPLGVLQSATGISRLRVLGADPTTGRETALAAGKYITNNVYVEVVTDTRGYTATQLEVSLTKALSVLSQAGQFGGTGATARYRKRY